MPTYDWMFPDFNRGEIEWDQDFDLSDETAQQFVVEANPETPAYDSRLIRAFTGTDCCFGIVLVQRKPSPD